MNKWIKAHQSLIELIIGMGLVVVVFGSTIGCPFRFLFGISCAGCGMTRALLALIQLNFKDAFYYHPLVYLLPFICLCIVFRSRMNKKLYKWSTYIVIALFIIVYLVRLLDSGNSIVTINITQGLIYKMISNLL